MFRRPDSEATAIRLNTRTLLTAVSAAGLFVGCLHTEPALALGGKRGAPQTAQPSAVVPVMRDNARRVIRAVKDRKPTGAQETIGDYVRDRMGATPSGKTARPDLWLTTPGKLWRVNVTLPSGRSRVTATWTVDQTSLAVTPVNDAALSIERSLRQRRAAIRGGSHPGG